MTTKTKTTRASKKVSEKPIAIVASPAIKKVSHLRLIAGMDYRVTPTGKTLLKGESETLTVEQCLHLVNKREDNTYELVPSLKNLGIWSLENVEAV